MRAATLALPGMVSRTIAKILEVSIAYLATTSPPWGGRNPRRRPRLVSASNPAMVVRWPGAEPLLRQVLLSQLQWHTPPWLFHLRWSVVA